MPLTAELPQLIRGTTPSGLKFLQNFFEVLESHAQNCVV